jgi:hypothetical protein
MQSATSQGDEAQGNGGRGCSVHLDRIAQAYPLWSENPSRKIPAIEGFSLKKDTFARRQGKIRTYRRVRSLENMTTGTRIFLQYDRAHGWLKPVRLTAVGSDFTGILPADLERIAKAFSHNLRVVMTEISFDFDPTFGVDRDYVLKHGHFGKSHPAHNPRYPDTLRYGSRHSEKLIRAYFKQQIKKYRVELELHVSRFAGPRSHYLLYAFPL